MKATCIIFVILIHSQLLDESKPIYMLFVEKAVPVFMMLSGYMMAIRANGRSLKEWYSGREVMKRLIRYTVPMLIAFVVHEFLWVIGAYITNSYQVSIKEIIQNFLLCDYGMGSYYYALMFEFVFISPFLLYLIRRMGSHGIIVAGLVDICFELFSSAYGISNLAYKNSILRYLFIISLGMYVGHYKKRRIEGKYLASSLAIGIVFILAPVYWKYEYRVFTEPTRPTSSMIAALYVFPIIYLILFYGKEYTSRTFVGKTGELIGRASYHIMYTQMIYFAVRPYFDRLIFDLSAVGKTYQMMMDITLPVIAGVVFYFLDQKYLCGRLTKYIERHWRQTARC